MAVGIKGAFLHIGDQNIPLDHSYLGVAKADIKGMQGNLTNVNGSNQIQYTYAEPSKPTMTLTINRAGEKLIAKLTGEKQAGKSSNLFVEGDTLPQVGVAVVTPNLGGDTDYMVVFDKARAVVQSLSLSTNTDSKKNVVADQITFNANYSENIGGTVAKGDIPVDGAADELKALGWPEPTANTGDFKDDTSNTAVTTNSHS